MKDLSDVRGAERLAYLIESYWEKRGFQVEVKQEKQAFSPDMRYARVDVRSDMKNGFPTKRLNTNKRVSYQADQ